MGEDAMCENSQEYGSQDESLFLKNEGAVCVRRTSLMMYDLYLYGL